MATTEWIEELEDNDNSVTENSVQLSTLVESLFIPHFSI